MKNNERAETSINTLKKILGQEPKIILAIVFGSMATGKFNRNSDIDLAVKMEEEL